MSFLGCIDHLSLPEILQIVSAGKRSGILTLIGKGGTGRIQLSFGRVVYASCDSRSRLGFALVQKNILSIHQLKRTLLKQRRSPDKRPIGTLLLEQGLVSKEVLEREVRDHIIGVFRDLLRWTDGVFYFQKADDPHGAVLLHSGLHTEFLLLECARQEDEEEQHNLDRELWTC